MKKAIILSVMVILALSVSHASFAAATYTGLIVDARELKVDPSKSPHLYDNTGREIYGTMDIDPDYVEKVGIVQYANTIYDAITQDLVGDNPIVVRAIRRGAHPYKSDIVISADDGKWIKRADQNSLFLEKLKVVFVI